VSEGTTIAIVSASGSVALTITALVLNFCLFNSLEEQIEVVEADLNTSFAIRRSSTNGSAAWRTTKLKGPPGFYAVST
jgi:hypothetical protein